VRFALTLAALIATGGLAVSWPQRDTDAVTLLHRLVDSGTLPDLRWAKFSAEQTEVAKFYASREYTVAMDSRSRANSSSRSPDSDSLLIRRHFTDTTPRSTSYWRKATFIPIGSLPTPYATDIDVNEIGLGVIPYASTAQGQSSIAKKGGSQARQTDVDGLGLHMQAALRDTGSMRP
jgi:hypothetical protein